MSPVRLPHFDGKWSKLLEIKTEIFFFLHLLFPLISSGDLDPDQKIDFVRIRHFFVLEVNSLLYQNTLMIGIIFWVSFDKTTTTKDTVD